ncbi:MAG: PstS family phosphate ABC transporter substrate-binding protein [Phycisphaeraceae bacterium]|nr:PstS family phosphate ABC transporter substrate-binding protein [Phycisphaeraceae bacterium]
MKTAMATVALAATVASAQVKVDSQLPKYQKTTEVSGTIKSVGSDTMNNLMNYWGEEFAKFYPNVNTEVDGKGSSTAPPALTEGQSTFGPMSRAMKSSEVEEFEKAFGYKPTQLRTAVDSLAIFVHKDCPLDSISLEQAKMVFSVEGPTMTWGDLGVTNPRYRNKIIQLYGRNSASGTYGYFKEHALGKTDYKPTVKEQPGSSAVVSACATDPYAMGYSGVGYKTDDVKVLNISKRTGEEAFSATADNAYSGKYPLARFLYVYVNFDKSTGLEPLRAEFIKMIYSQAGQEAVVKDGYFPVSAIIAREDLKKVGITPLF